MNYPPVYGVAPFGMAVVVVAAAAVVVVVVVFAFVGLGMISKPPTTNPKNGDELKKRTNVVAPHLLEK